MCTKAELDAGSTGQVQVQTGRHVDQCFDWPICSCPARTVGTVVSPLLTVLEVHNVYNAVTMLGVHCFGVQMRECMYSFLGLTCPVSFEPGFTYMI